MSSSQVTNWLCSVGRKAARVTRATSDGASQRTQRCAEVGATELSPGDGLTAASSLRDFLLVTMVVSHARPGWIGPTRARTQSLVGSRLSYTRLATCRRRNCRRIAARIARPSWGPSCSSVTGCTAIVMAIDTENVHGVFRREAG